MTLPIDEPWFLAALQLLEPRPADRVLVVGCTAAHVRTLQAMVGKDGEVTVADAVAHVPAGAFGALLVLAPWGPLLPSGRYASLARAHLRPGGRCVFDLPGLPMVPELAAAAVAANWPADRLAVLQGIADDDLAEVLRNAGLRGVRGLLGAHLLHLASPEDLVERFAAVLDLTADERTDLVRLLVTRAGGIGPVDLLVHRTRVQAQR